MKKKESNCMRSCFEPMPMNLYWLDCIKKFEVLGRLCAIRHSTVDMGFEPMPYILFSFFGYLSM